MTNATPSAAEARIAGAPVSWGVCEVPGWGYQLGPDRVLAEMRQVGLTATELGPDGFLPAQPDAMSRVLDHHGLQAVGGFTPLLLHVASHDPVPEVERLLQGYDATGAGVLVLSAVTGAEGYDTRPVLDDDGWMVLLTNLDRLAELAASRGVRAVLHPHIGTPFQGCRRPPRPAGPGRPSDLHPRGARGNVPPTRDGRRGRAVHRRIPARPRLQRLVRAGAGHHPDRGTAW